MAKRPKLTSGDWLVDWFFEKFVAILNHPDFDVIRVSRLKLLDRRGRKVEVYAFMDGDSLYFNTSRTLHSSDDKKGVTLCHELLHVLFREGVLPRTTTVELYGMEPVRHKDIYFLERLWGCFGRDQQSFLLSFLSRACRLRAD